MARKKLHPMDTALGVVGMGSVFAGGVLAFQAWWWACVGLAVLVWCSSLALIWDGSGRKPREAVTAGVALSAIPLGVAAAVEWAWWWSLVALLVLVGAGVFSVSSKLDREARDA
jgi:hypothetical protein